MSPSGLRLSFLSVLTLVGSSAFLLSTVSAAAPSGPVALASLPCTQSGLVIDDGDCGHRFAGGVWNLTTGGYKGDQYFSQGAPKNQQANDSRSIWKFDNLTNDLYSVYVTWDAAGSGLTGIATNSPFTVWNGTTNIATVRVDQKAGPQVLGSVLYNGKYWVKLGEYNITNSYLQVNLRNFANGKVIADAVRIEKKSQNSGKFIMTVKAQATSDVVVENQKNVTFVRFEARADSNADVLLTDLTFEAASSSSLVNGQNYSFWVDTDSNGVVDTILETGVSAQSGQVTFDNLMGGGYVIAKQASATVFEVHADIAASISGTNPVLALRFDTGATFVHAKWVSDGAPLVGIGTKNPAGQYEPSEGTYVDGGVNAEIQTQVVYATVYTIRESGDLYTVLSSTPLRHRQLLGGSLENEILRLQLHSEYEDIDVTDFVFTGSGMNASSFATNVQRLELYLVGATTPFAYATVGDCGTDPVPAFSMCASMQGQQLIIAKGSNTDILIRPRMNTDENGAATHQAIALYMDPTPSSLAGSVRARGLISSNDLAVNDGDNIPEGESFIGISSASQGANRLIKSKYNEVVLSKVISITNADPNANGTAVPSGLQKDIGQFKFSTAAANNFKNGTNKWTLSDIIFNVNATNINLDGGSFKLYNKADSTVTSACTLVGSTASSALVVRCDAITASGVNSEIDPGTDVTFVLRVDITNSKVISSSSSTLQVSFTNFAELSLSSSYGPSGSHIQWLDKDNAALTPASTFRWIEYPETSVNGTVYQS